MQPLKYAVYKGIGGSKYGCVQFSLKLPRVTEKTDKGFEVGDPGCVFVECAPTTGPNVYDWNNKIIFALSVGDMGKIVSGLTGGNEVKLVHDPGAKSDQAGQVNKNLTFTAPGDKGCLFYLNENNKANPEGKKYCVPLTNDELLIIVTLLRSAISTCLAWSV